VKKIKFKITPRGLIQKDALRRPYKIFLVIGFVAVLFIPLLPLTLKGSSIMNDKPEFCIMCHTMIQEYRNWSHSAHRNWAVCSDCHVSQQTIVTKLAGKLRDSLNHGYAYAFNRIPEPIRLKRLSAETVMQNCIRCHGQLVEKINKGDRRCWDCHRDVPHGY
jgi:cytochrome c nitrite reductase small subunit